MSRTLRLFAALLAFGLLAAACGQKQGVHVGFAGGAGGPGTAQGATEDGFAYVDTDGDGQADTQVAADGSFDDGLGDGGAGSFDTAGTTGGDTSGGGGSTGGDPSTPSGGGGGSNDQAAGSGTSSDGQGGGGDSTGITADTIKIGVHAPLTGAAPIPQRSFHEGKDQYWNVVGEVFGRKIEVVFRDDKYNPSAASQACQELILKEKVFMLSGSGGTDQIAECARIAARYGVPYLSAGVTKVGLDKLPNYFAQSKSYSDQMPLLIQWISKNRAPQNKKLGLVASNTANFDDAVQGFQTEAKKAGFQPVVYRPSKAPSDGELAGVAQRMVTDGVTVATPVMQPTAWLKLAKNPQLNNVDWAGVGVTMGLNSVANVACPEADGAMFFSPFPGYNLAPQMDSRFPGDDDIQWAQWGSNKMLHTILNKMGPNNLNREAFIKAMYGPIETGLFPATNHSPNNHFNVTSVHVLHLDCSQRQFISSKSDLFRKNF